VSEQDHSQPDLGIAMRGRIAEVIHAALILAAAMAIEGVRADERQVADSARPPRQMEKLGRGVVAIRRGDGEVYVGWRMLGTDPEEVAFDLYRVAGDDRPVKLNDRPITESTNFVDRGADRGRSNSYFVVPIMSGVEQEASARFTLSANAPARQYISIPLKTPEGCTPNDASAGDLDGDGEYELVVKQEMRGRDNARDGFTGQTKLEAYTLAGDFLWRIDLGRNIREGAHYTQFIVYDLDGDGRAEVALKTADGTVDGTGKVIGDPDANWVNDRGKILDGPEYLTIFDGRTGAALAAVDYIPPRGDIGGWGGVGGNGGNDRSGNRVDRFLACVAYLDGVHPSVVMCRGYYGRSVLAAWDWRDGRLASRWVFDSAKPGLEKYSGQGNHSVSVADVDGDGRDEIVYGAMVVDDDGTGLFSTDLRHGDALHVSDLDPTRPGLEVWGIHENEVPVPGYENGFGAAMYDAATGQVLWGKDPGRDVGRGVAADIDADHLGAECWGGSGGLYSCKGEPIGPTPSSANFVCWWDGDLLRELLDGTRIEKYHGPRLLTADGCLANNGSKATPALSADLFGDWREEVVWRTEDGNELRIFTTTIPTTHRIYTLMHDPQYRLSIAWQNVAYNQPPHVGFFLGVGMARPPRPRITTQRAKRGARF
jgi:rhamnogalacturonan endolyase